MAVTPINVARVSQNLRAFNLLETLRASQAGLFRVQNQLSTGLKFLAPSEDPLNAGVAAVLDRHMDALNQVRTNLRDANSFLTAGEDAVKDGTDLLTQAHTLALESVGDTMSTEERHSLANVVDSLVQQMVAVGNRRHRDQYLFSGHYGDGAPLEQVGNSVLYRGDAGRSQAIVETDFSQDSFTISGKEFFPAVSEEIRGFVDLDPALTRDTRISDLRGTAGRGVRLGRISVSDGAQQKEIDLSGAATVGDLLDKLNAEMPNTLEATFDARKLMVQAKSGAGPVEITITDVGAGQAARDLGLKMDSNAADVPNPDLDPILTPRVKLDILNTGAGINLAGGITIRNGGNAATFDFSDAKTLEDVLNRINQSNLGAWAKIGSDGRTLEVLNRLSGGDLSVEENGGQAATALGIRSMQGGTPLANLNDGKGIETIPGNDIRVTTADGGVMELDLDGAKTLQDVLDIFNAAGAGRFTAALAAQGNGLVITDNTSGGGTLTIAPVNFSPALEALGLNVTADNNALRGRDVAPVRVDGAFTALLELRNGLLSDNTRQITAAGERLDRVLKKMQEAQGRLAAQAKTMADRADRAENEITATRVLQSDTRDVDIAEAVVKFQQTQNALQANLNTASRILNLSLLDFLR